MQKRTFPHTQAEKTKSNSDNFWLLLLGAALASGKGSSTQVEALVMPLKQRHAVQKGITYVGSRMHRSKHRLLRHLHPLPIRLWTSRFLGAQINA
jgi:hypothetical protein